MSLVQADTTKTALHTAQFACNVPKNVPYSLVYNASGAGGCRLLFGVAQIIFINKKSIYINCLRIYSNNINFY